MTLIDFDPDAEDKLLAAICYPHSNLPDQQLLNRVRRLGADERLALVRAYVGERENRRHKPGRAFERSTTASTCCPTTGPSVTCSATAC